MSFPNRDHDPQPGSGNPYQSPTATEPSQPRGALATMARIALALVALLLVIRGVVLTVAWVGILGRTGVPSDHFMAAILVKDGSYAVSALLGGMLLVVPNRYSWWGAVVNWALFLGFEVLLVMTGGLLGWRMPHRTVPELATEVMVRSIAWGRKRGQVSFSPPRAVALYAGSRRKRDLTPFSGFTPVPTRRQTLAANAVLPWHRWLFQPLGAARRRCRAALRL